MRSARGSTVVADEERLAAARSLIRAATEQRRRRLCGLGPDVITRAAESIISRKLEALRGR